MPLSYSEWVAAAVDRWAGSFSIAAWELLGEPEVGVCTTPDCDLHQRRCPEDSSQVLRDWVDAAGAVARAHDQRHLLTLGLLGGEQCGLADGGYALVAASPYLDVVQYHDYDDAAFLPLRLEQTEKPVLVAEFGIRAGSCLPLTERATRVGTQIDRYHTTGAVVGLRTGSSTTGMHVRHRTLRPDPRLAPAEIQTRPGPARRGDSRLGGLGTKCSGRLPPPSLW